MSETKASTQDWISMLLGKYGGNVDRGALAEHLKAQETEIEKWKTRANTCLSCDFVANGPIHLKGHIEECKNHPAHVNKELVRQLRVENEALVAANEWQAKKIAEMTAEHE